MIDEIFQPNEHKKTSNLHQKICKRCGTAFMGRPAAKYCSDCRLEVKRERERAFRHKSKEAIRKLGSVDKCLKCGKEYIVTAGKQKYCPACAEEATRENIRTERKIYMQEKRESSPKLVKEWKRTKYEERHCLVCGDIFTPKTYKQKACEKCKEIFNKYKQYLVECRRTTNKEKNIGPMEFTTWLAKRKEKQAKK